MLPYAVESIVSDCEDRMLDIADMIEGLDMLIDDLEDCINEEYEEIIDDERD